MKVELRWERLRRGMTQKELAEKSGVSIRLISQIEKGDFESISYKKMKKLSKTLGLSLNQLFPEE